ncbi:MAG: SRPBCC family protein [Chloroflexi bacterium]|nr:SRPBCC family protein [Chloroflexota bacterium]
MIIEEKFVIDFPRQRVWDFLMNDVQGVLTCVPGTEAVDVIDQENYQGLLKVKVGPVSAKFQGKVTVHERDANVYHASMIAEGTESKLSSLAKAKVSMHLNAIAETQTEVVVTGDVRILGMLGQFGQGIIKGKAHSLMGEFAGRIRARLEQVPLLI